jgi:gliding motility-associated lipoprotein GldH
MNKSTDKISYLVCTLLLCCSVMLSGCLDSPYYQKQASIPLYKWDYKFTPTFEFEVTDTTYLYNVYFIIRHTDAYPYANVWMNMYRKEPGDTTFTKQRINVQLAIPAGKNAGQWMGRGMGELWEQRLAISHPGDPEILSKKGKYVFRFEQNMRINPLPEILQVGLRVEKGNRRKP